LKTKAHGKSIGLWSEQNPNYKGRNEDAACAGIILSASGQKIVFAAIADGVSGLPNGDVAARLAAKWPQDFIPAATFNSNEEFIDILKREFKKLNDTICSLPGGAGSTLTIVFMYHNESVVLHVGDTTCFYFTFNDDGDPSSLTLTQSDSVVGLAGASGMTDEELEQMHQHALAKSLGDPNIEPSIFVNPLKFNIKRGYLLLTTDGITDVWSSSEILPELNEELDMNIICRRLCDAALVRKKKNQRPNRDNITCVLIKLDEIQVNAEYIVESVGSAVDEVIISKKEGAKIDYMKNLSKILYIAAAILTIWYIAFRSTGKPSVLSEPPKVNISTGVDIHAQGAHTATQYNGKIPEIIEPKGSYKIDSGKVVVDKIDDNLRASIKKNENRELYINGEAGKKNQAEADKKNLKDPRNGSI
jgi:protein phosphatase